MIIARQWTPRQVLWRLGLAVLPAALWLAWDLYRGDPKLVSPGPPYEIVYNRPLGDVLAPSTSGMTISSEGYGTVLRAPSVSAIMSDVAPSGEWPEVADDVARFIRIFPTMRWRPQSPLEPMICAGTGQAAYRGTVVLKNGCLQLRSPHMAPEEAGVILAGVSVFRDAEGYLAIGNRSGPDEFRLRVGEENGLLTAAGCGKASHAAAPEYAKICGAGSLVTISRASRRPICSAKYYADQARQHAEYEEAAKRQAKIAADCRALGERSCPPAGVPAPPPQDLDSGCLPPQ